MLNNFPGNTVPIKERNDFPLCVYPRDLVYGIWLVFKISGMENLGFSPSYSCPEIVNS
jgi:hypothetical protein